MAARNDETTALCKQAFRRNDNKGFFRSCVKQNHFFLSNVYLSTR
ncbi:hypothetical protein REIS_1430 [Rickettsia endosymbiont of Ixodes scapularis]|nr:hypothetical protein REIS_1430 [Rickettsia endosymbiont of Ixodes scapularis]